MKTVNKARTYQTKHHNCELVTFPKPRQPIRETRDVSITIHTGMELEDVIEWAQDVSGAEFDFDYDYDSVYVSLRGKKIESDEEFAQRCKIYNEEVDNWKEWYKINKEEVEENETRKKVAKKTIAEAKALEEKRRLEVILEKTNKQLKKLKEGNK